MWSYRFVLQDVSSVIGGFCVDGVSPLPKPVSFTKRQDVLDGVVSLAQVLYTFIGATERNLAADHETRTAIVFKLLAFLTKTGRVTPDAVRGSIQDIAGVATILSERPELILASVNFAGLLARHTQAQQERAVKRARNRAVRDAAPSPVRRSDSWMVTYDEVATCATVPDRPVIWQSIDRQYCLQELVHPRHLVEETRALDHCVGRHFAGDYGEGEAIHRLAYWQYIKSGQSRIFSFACSSGPKVGPLCTLHIRLPGCTLVEAGPARPRVLTGAEPYFSALRASLEGLETALGCKLCVGTGRSVHALRRWREARRSD